ncbi:MAG TPA: hypothetical protein VK808_00770 [Bacteroidia bacterium]|nr:hypothetical protein [Bacteroidia bacterium]
MKILSFLKKISYCSLFIALTLFVNSCVNKSNVDVVATKPVPKDTALNKASADTTKAWQDEDFGKISFDRKYNDIARYIAGMKAWPGSPYAKLENDSVWARFHRNFDFSWNQIATSRLEPMTEWGNTELVEERKSNLDVFYPLSGPDILHVNYFFPDAKNYRMYALEINGALPDLAHMNIKTTENYLDAVYKSLGDIFKRSYFITSKMSTALNADNVNGTLPLICVFLVRTGHEIINLKYFHLNDDGTETELPKDSLGTHHNDLVKVYFKNSKNNSIQMVSYMKCDLSDAAYAKNIALKNMFTKMKPCITYLKSASYLLHYAFFSSFRDVILTKSKTILEDDTGIPYKYFPGDKWYVSLYGVYVNPVSDFSGVFQTDLLQAYKDTILRKPKKLPFSLGYHWGSSKQNLIKAQLRS